MNNKAMQEKTRVRSSDKGEETLLESTFKRKMSKQRYLKIYEVVINLCLLSVVSLHTKKIGLYFAPPLTIGCKNQREKIRQTQIQTTDTDTENKESNHLYLDNQIATRIYSTRSKWIGQLTVHHLALNVLTYHFDVQIVPLQLQEQLKQQHSKYRYIAYHKRETDTQFIYMNTYIVSVLKAGEG